MTYRFRVLTGLLLVLLPSPLFAEEVFFRGMVSQDNKNDYAIYGAVTTNGGTSQGYVLLFNADWDYYFATITTPPQGAGSAGAAAHPGSTATQPTPTKSNSPPASTVTNRGQGNGEPPSGGSNSQHQTANPSGSGQIHGSGGSGNSSGSGSATARGNAGSQGSPLNLVGIIVASSEVAAENTTIKTLLNPATGVMVVTTSKGIDLTGKGFVMVRPTGASNNANPSTANPGTQAKPK